MAIENWQSGICDRSLVIIHSDEALLLKVGLTGGMASGKSVVAGMFAALGAHVVEADVIAHQLLQPGEAVYDEVVRHFGPAILNADSTVNRARLAEAAFGSPNRNAPLRIEELNRIVHPAVIKRQEEWMDAESRKDPHGIAMVEAALILEAGAGKRFDRLVVVTCQPEQRAQRWARRLGVDEDTARREVARRMASQLPDEEKIKAADFVINNSGSLDETQRQVTMAYSKLRQEAERTGTWDLRTEN